MAAGGKKKWSFRLNKLGKEESLTAPLGYKCSIADVAVKSSAGKKNLTQIEVMENVRYLLAHRLSAQY